MAELVFVTVLNTHVSRKS